MSCFFSALTLLCKNRIQRQSVFCSSVICTPQMSKNQFNFLSMCSTLAPIVWEPRLALLEQHLVTIFFCIIVVKLLFVLYPYPYSVRTACSNDLCFGVSFCSTLAPIVSEPRLTTIYVLQQCSQTFAPRKCAKFNWHEIRCQVEAAYFFQILLD